MKYTDDAGIKVNTNVNPESSSVVAILINVVPTVLLIGAMLYILTKISGTNKNSMDLVEVRLNFLKKLKHILVMLLV